MFIGGALSRIFCERQIIPKAKQHQMFRELRACEGAVISNRKSSSNGVLPVHKDVNVIHDLKVTGIPCVIFSLDPGNVNA